MEKTLYRITGTYKYRGIKNNIPKECEYLYATPGTIKWVLKYKIAALRGLVKTEAAFIYIKNAKIEEIKK